MISDLGTATDFRREARAGPGPREGPQRLSQQAARAPAGRASRRPERTPCSPAHDTPSPLRTATTGPAEPGPRPAPGFQAWCPWPERFAARGRRRLRCCRFAVCEEGRPQDASWGQPWACVSFRAGSPAVGLGGGCAASSCRPGAVRRAVGGRDHPRGLGSSSQDGGARSPEPRGQAAAWRALRALRARGKESRSRVDAPERPCAALAPAVTASGVTRLSLSLWGWGRVHSPKKSSGQACRGPGGRFSGDSEGLDRDRQRVCSP